MGQDVVRLLDHLNIARAHIVGHSMGAGITAQLLTTNPDRFLTATLSGSAGRQGWTSEAAAAAEAEAVEFEQGIPFRSVILRTAPTDQPKPTDEQIQAQSQQRLARNDRFAMAALVRSRGEQAFSAAQMATVQVPTLGLIGSADANLAAMQTTHVGPPDAQSRGDRGRHARRSPGGGATSRVRRQFPRVHCGPQRGVIITVAEMRRTTALYL